MRQKRAKAYRKLMALYSMSFGFRQPYQVLIDSEMCKTATEHKIELVKQLGTVLQGTVKPMITQCCIHELYLQGKSLQPAVDLAKEFERRKCNHREAIPGDECLASVIGETNKHRYVVATQSQPLRVKLRAIPAVPIVHVNRSVMVLEPPSDATLKIKAMTEEEALHPTAPDLALVPPTAPTQVQKKKGPKAPNPLSMKKKKKPKGEEAGGKKDKGKSKATHDDLTGVISEESVGAKRKRTGQEDEHGAKIADSEPATTDVDGGHKRKRRRKKGTTEGPPDDE
ncbi:Fcf1-domain-containing protein [Athelia psychrophila]|uniref:U three protein 23 n=1 Tax=Athelia psychrophila TaxID=1759441 RepID=A0A166AWN3_9AGAM|nr:Fcf1-domain-containing protein [Fibularhizoctonia sp. CBS 109695]